MDLDAYMKHLASNSRNRPLMTRILFNRMRWSGHCPVDVSELQRLSVTSRAIVNGFLDWSSSGRDLVGGERLWEDLKPWFEPQGPLPRIPLTNSSAAGRDQS